MSIFFTAQKVAITAFSSMNISNMVHDFLVARLLEGEARFLTYDLVKHNGWFGIVMPILILIYFQKTAICGQVHCIYWQ